MKSTPSVKAKDIGLLHGPLLVFGGIYSNLQALQALQFIAKKRGIPPGNIICTGDIVAYCAQPEACLQLVKEWGIHCISGNVEAQLREGSDDCACDFVSGGRCEGFSQRWYPYARAHVGESSLEWLHSLPDHLSFRYAGKRVAVVHGSYHNRSEYIFASTSWAAKATNFAALDAEVILAGHSGLPFVEQQDDRCWLNAGVIGMPANDGTPRVWYAVLDDSAGFHFAIQPFTYEHKTAARLMDAANLPPEYAQTLLSGLWDNCEILPPQEANQQGMVLSVINGLWNAS